LLNKSGAKTDMAPGAVQAAIAGWSPKSPSRAKKPTRTKARKTAPKSEARRHVDQVAAARKKAVADMAARTTKERRRRELNKVASLEFRTQLAAAGRARDAEAEAADREADEAEAIAMGKTAAATKDAPKEGAALLAQYESMPQGAKRIEFWNKNKSAIFRALNNR